MAAWNRNYLNIRMSNGECQRNRRRKEKHLHFQYIFESCSTNTEFYIVPRTIAVSTFRRQCIQLVVDSPFLCFPIDRMKRNAIGVDWPAQSAILCSLQASSSEMVA